VADVAYDVVVGVFFFGGHGFYFPFLIIYPDGDLGFRFWGYLYRI
jgi:hypothetical protein